MISDLVKIVGTGHVFKESAERARKTILKQKPSVVAVELDRERYISLLHEEYGGKEKENGVTKNNVLNPWSFMLSKVQEKLGKQFGMAPGGDMLSAIKAAKEIGAEIALIDQDFRITMSHISNAPVNEKFMLLKEGLGIFLSNESIGEIENETFNVEELMTVFKDNYPFLFRKLVFERDKFMGKRILQILRDVDNFNKPTVVAVVGMGHSAGIKKYLRAR